MRKTIVTLIATLATLGAVAGTAAADDPGATHSYGGTMGMGVGTITVQCRTPFRVGNAFQYGAWGFYNDGCTSRTGCGNDSHWCEITTHSYIETGVSRGDRVTMNSRVRIINAATGQVTWFRDQSCAGTNVCANDDAVTIYPGQDVSIQCNGVHQWAPLFANTARDNCYVALRKRW